jgi:hypothetical protein
MPFPFVPELVAGPALPDPFGDALPPTGTRALLPPARCARPEPATSALAVAARPVPLAGAWSASAAAGGVYG